MDLVEFINVIRKWKWLVLAVVLVVTGAAVLTAYRAEDSYRAEATLVVGLSQITSSAESGISVVRSGGDIAATYAELLTVNDVMVAAVDKAGVSLDPSSLKGAVSPQVSTDAPIIRVQVTDSDPGQAIILTNAVSEAFVEYIDDVNFKENEQAKEEILAELTSIEDKIATGSAQGSGISQTEINALERQRETVLNGYEELLQQQVGTGDIKVVEVAERTSVVGINTTQTIIIGFIISLTAGIVFAFIAEGISKSFQYSY